VVGGGAGGAPRGGQSSGCEEFMLRGFHGFDGDIWPYESVFVLLLSFIHHYYSWRFNFQILKN